MSALSDQVLAISKPYLGPAAESFLGRQCKAHLKVDFQQLNSGHLKDLARWVEVGAALIMDQAKAVEVAKKIAAC